MFISLILWFGGLVQLLTFTDNSASWMLLTFVGLGMGILTGACSFLFFRGGFIPLIRFCEKEWLTYEK